jgi:competence protein ComEC
MPNLVFYPLICGFVGGVFLGSIGLATTWVGYLFLSIGLSLFLWFIFSQPPAGNKILIILSVIFVSIALGILRYELNRAAGFVEALEQSIGQTVTVSGVVVDEPDRREKDTRLQIRIKSILIGDIETPVMTGALAVVSRYADFEYGDAIRMTGVIKKPENFETESGRIFNYRGYLAKDGIFYEFYKPVRVELVGKNQGNPIKAKLFRFKRLFVEQLSRIIPPPEVSLLAGLLLGAKRALGSELLDAFRATGVVHLVVLSGYNLTIVADSVRRFFSFLPRRAALFFSVFAIAAFTIMTGAAAATTRAAIMAGLAISAKFFYRSHQVVRALFLAGFIMVLINPLILVFDPGFLLSFLATAGLIFVSPLVEKFIVPKLLPRPIREAMITTMATQIFVLPFLIYQIGEISLVAIIANLLILAVVPATMLFGFLTGLVGFLSYLLAAPFGFIAFLLLRYELLVVEILNQVPMAAITLPAMPFLLMAAWYAFYGWSLIKLRSLKLAR